MFRLAAVSRIIKEYTCQNSFLVSCELTKPENYSLQKQYLK